jgi:hypothetical protein
VNTRVSALIAGALLLGSLVRGEPLTVWSPRVPSSTYTGPLTFGNGTYVTTDRFSSPSGVYISTDQKGWQRYYTGLAGLRSIAFDGQRFVALARQAEVVFSDDGIEWTGNGGMVPGNPVAIAFGNALYVASSSEGIFTSPDALEWTLRAPPVAGLLRLKYSDGRFLGCGSGGVVVVSLDGISWQTEFVGEENAHLLDLLGRNGTIVVAGRMEAEFFLSAYKEGEGWRRAPTENAPFLSGASVAFGKGVFVAAGATDTFGRSRGFFVSTNGFDWNGVNPQNLSGWLESDASIVFNGDRFVAVDSKGAVASSSDGYEWIIDKIVPLSPAEIIYKGTYGGGRFVIPKLDGAMLVSSDGKQWRRFATPWCTYRDPMSQYGNDIQAQDVAYGNSKYLAIAPEGSLISTNAVDWAAQAEPVGAHIQYGGGKFVAINGAHSRVSTDGINWTASTLVSTGIVSDLIFGGSDSNGLFVAAGSGGSVSVSSNGVTWRQARTGAPENTGPAKLAYGNGLFVATAPQWTLGPDGFWISVSTDGVTWSTNKIGGTVFPLIEVVFAYDRFVIFAAGKVLVSADGVVWRELQPLSLGYLTSAIYGEGSLIITNPLGGIAQSGMLARIAADRGVTGEIRVGWAGDPGLELEVSTDLLNWSPLENNASWPQAGASRGFVRGVWRR